MAIYSLPPSPFVGGRQPLAPANFNPAVSINPPTVDDPPFRRAGILAAVFIAWSPDVLFVQSVTPIPQEAEVVEETVPFTRHHEIFINWIPEVINTQPRIFTPIVATPADQFVPYTRHPEVYSSWTTRIIYAQIIESIPETPVVEQIAFTRHQEIFNSWISEPVNPQLQKKLIPQSAAVVEQVPYTKHNEILINWRTEQQNPQIPRKLKPASIDNPPIKSKIDPSALINWRIEQPIIQKYNKFVFTPQTTVNDPPFNSRTILPAIIAWNIPPDPTVQKQNKFISETAPVTGFVPYTRHLEIIAINWEAAYRLPQLGVKLVQPGPPVNNPPFGQRTWLSTILYAWEPPPPSFVYPIQIVQPFVAPLVNDPPFGRRVLWLNTVLDAWIPPPPPPWNPVQGFTPPESSDIIIWLWKRVS